MELRTSLDEKLTEKFLVVKEHLGVKANNSVLAFVIGKEYDRIQDSRYRRLYVENETYERAEKEAEAQGVSVDIYVTELVEKTLKKTEEGEKDGN